MVFVTLPASKPSFYVHLCSGDVDVIAPADEVSLDATMVTLLDGEQVKASYDRRLVMFVSREMDALAS